MDMTVIKDIAAVVGVILSLISLSGICFKSVRVVIKKLFIINTKEIAQSDACQTKDIMEVKEKLDMLTSDMYLIKDASKQQCRNIIKNIYYKYISTKVIPIYERKTADSIYDLYHNGFKGNSYITLLYDQIVTWEVDASERTLED